MTFCRWGTLVSVDSSDGRSESDLGGESGVTDFPLVQECTIDQRSFSSLCLEPSVFWWREQAWLEYCTCGVDHAYVTPTLAVVYWNFCVGFVWHISVEYQDHAGTGGLHATDHECGNSLNSWHTPRSKRETERDREREREGERERQRERERERESERERETERAVIGKRRLGIDSYFRSKKEVFANST